MKKPAELFECALGYHDYGDLKYHPYIADEYGCLYSWYKECNVCGNKFLIEGPEFTSTFEVVLSNACTGIIVSSDK